MKKLKKLENYTTSEMFLLILLVITVIPFLYTIPAFFERFDYSTTGQIGDTIGGITAPFINGLAAILVFAAFKAQIQANQIFKEGEMSRTILDQIKIIQENEDIDKDLIFLENRLSNLAVPSDIHIKNAINRIIFFTTEVSLAENLISKYTGERDFLYRKLHYLYVIRHKDSFSYLMERLGKVKPHQDYEVYIYELLDQIDTLNKKLDNLAEYHPLNTKTKK